MDAFECKDRDIDGFKAGVTCVDDDIDCDDTNDQIFPGQVEECGDGVDDDCSGADTVCDAVISYTVDEAVCWDLSTEIDRVYCLEWMDVMIVDLQVDELVLHWATKGGLTETNTVPMSGPQGDAEGMLIDLGAGLGYAWDSVEDDVMVNFMVVVQLDMEAGVVNVGGEVMLMSGAQFQFGDGGSLVLVP